MRNVLQRTFKLMSFILVHFRFWDMVDFVFYIRSELGLKRFFEPDSATITSDTR